MSEPHPPLVDMEAQAQKMEALARMAGGVAHDFNNFLTVIMTCAEMVGYRLRPADPAQAEIRQILDTVDRASRLTRTLVTFRGDRRDPFPVIDLGDSTRDLEPTLRRLLTEHHGLELALPTEALPVRVSPTALAQIVMNLATNARDALREGGRVYVGVRPIENPQAAGTVHHGRVPVGAAALLCVRDEGVGMDTETLCRAFEPWFTTKGREKGVGLGLATVYGLVLQAEGFIGVDSSPGQGTTVTILLPMATAS